MFEIIKKLWRRLTHEREPIAEQSVIENPDRPQSWAEYTAEIVTRVKGDKLTRSDYLKVKHALRWMGRGPQTFEDVQDIADHYHMGRTTVYKVRASNSWADFNGDVVKVPVTDLNRKRPGKVKTKTVK